MRELVYWDSFTQDLPVGLQNRVPNRPCVRSLAEFSTDVSRFASRGEWPTTMWCRSCQQDVPGVADPTRGSRLTCARCGSFFAGSASPNAGSAVPLPGDCADALPDFVEQDLLSTQDLLDRTDDAIAQIRLLTRSQNRASAAVDEAAIAPGQTADTVRDEPVRVARKRPTSSAPWMVLCLGLAFCVCGTILTSWSILGGRAELWPIGVPILIGGQLAVLAAIVWQFESVWRSDQATFHALRGIGDQLSSVARSMARDADDPRRELAVRRHDTAHEVADTLQHWTTIQQQLDEIRADLRPSVDADD